ncbi:DUF1059 domain-containing protein [Anaeromyxobacter paludicola]|uniref:Small metal-binding protein n=1 Tax=Anaeromyxobacter paludicola TaxID=2918171 RepID=A0ABM7XBB1_9BACT|nr:DUF1059 domain-containing protein [Anaeromyxobacter paludicola]BDG09138.1 hypothetical protein AMPC_22510 [Anaeromyxobacter paludicola]
MKDFHCRDAGMDCDFVARGNSNQEIMEQARQHAQREHGMQQLSPDLAHRVEGLIHDESSEAHRSSMSRK